LPGGGSAWPVGTPRPSSGMPAGPSRGGAGRPRCSQLNHPPWDRCRRAAQGKRDGTTKDEPFAWASREFLRKKLIGQARRRAAADARRSAASQRAPRGAEPALRPRPTPLARPSPPRPQPPPPLPAAPPQTVTFRIDYVVEAIGNKEFGSVFLAADGGKQENVALSIVQNGWAKARGRGGKRGGRAAAATRLPVGGEAVFGRAAPRESCKQSRYSPPRTHMPPPIHTHTHTNTHAHTLRPIPGARVRVPAEPLHRGPEEGAGGRAAGRRGRVDQGARGALVAAGLLPRLPIGFCSCAAGTSFMSPRARLLPRAPPEGRRRARGRRAAGGGGRVVQRRRLPAEGRQEQARGRRGGGRAQRQHAARHAAARPDLGAARGGTRQGAAWFWGPLAAAVAAACGEGGRRLLSADCRFLLAAAAAMLHTAAAPCRRSCAPFPTPRWPCTCRASSAPR
jgi:hypothetical protein